MSSDRTVLHAPRAVADAQIAIAAFVAGAGWLFSIKALAGLPPLLFLGSRFVIAGLLIGIMASFPPIAALGRTVRLLLPGALAFAVAMIAWIFGLKQTANPGVAAFITSTGNLLVPVFGLLFFGWPVGARLWISIAIALAGMALLFLGPNARVEAAHIYFVVSALLWAASMAFVKHNSAAVGAGGVAAVQLVVAGFVILAASLVVEEVPAAVPSIEIWGWFLASVLISTCLRFVLQFRGQQSISAARASLIMCSEPVWVLLFSLTFLGAPLSLSQMLGCAVILLATLSQVFARPDLVG
ncbi:DMT family transporter [Ensifer sp. MJa1]|uniref:DMT family transporter n=1 Tax=Ensifer sp. MJa1 TaxID=2919888 RepID=UPI00300964E5